MPRPWRAWRRNEPGRVRRRHRGPRRAGSAVDTPIPDRCRHASVRVRGTFPASPRRRACRPLISTRLFLFRAQGNSRRPRETEATFPPVAIAADETCGASLQFPQKQGIPRPVGGRPRPPPAFRRRSGTAGNRTDPSVAALLCGRTLPSGTTRRWPGSRTSATRRPSGPSFSHARDAWKHRPRAAADPRRRDAQGGRPVDVGVADPPPRRQGTSRNRPSRISTRRKLPRSRPM